MDPRISVQLRGAALLTLALALGACGKQPAQQGASGPVITNAAPPPSANQPGVTPMAQRVAVIGILNKRNGLLQNVALHPGQSVRWKDVVVRLRACETTAPWEEEKLTGAFVQVDVQKPDRHLESGLLRLALQGVAVAQRRRAPGLRRLAQELRYDIPSWTARTDGAARIEQCVERSEVGRHGATAARPPRHHGVAAAERRRKQRHIGRARYRHRAERSEVLGHELAVEKREIADLEARDEPCQRDLGRIGLPAEHAFAEERAAEADAVEASGEQVAALVQTSIECAWPEA